MYYLSIVAVNHCWQKLLHNVSGIFLAEGFHLAYFIEKFSTIDVFCYQVEVLFVLIKLVQFDDTGVVQLLQDVYFIQEWVHVALSYVLFSDDLHSSVLPSQLVLHSLYFTVGTFSEGFEDSIPRFYLSFLFMDEYWFIYLQAESGFRC